jgi:Glycosyltransferase family 87
MWRNSQFGLLLAIVMAASMWFYFQRVLIRYQQADAAAHDRPRGNLSDLYPRWWGAHELLLHGRDPYSPEITREIQRGYYGRVLDPARPGDPKDEQGFAYPVYVVFLLAPTIHLPFPVVQRGFVILLWMLTAASVPLWLHILRWRPSMWQTATLIVLMLGSLPTIQGIKLQQLTLVVAGLLAASLAAITSGFFVTAGVLLALSTIKPQLASLPTCWLLLWALRGWRRRQRLVWSFAATLLLLLAAAQWVLPGWISRFRAAIEDYHRYTHNVSVLGWLLSPLGGNIAALALLLLLGWLCWPLLSEDQDSPAFTAMLATVLALSVVVVPMFAPYNQVLLLGPVLALWHSGEFRNQKRSIQFIVRLTLLLLFWPWAASLLLMLGSLVLPPATIQSWWKLPFITGLVLPIFLFVLTAIWTAKLRPVGGASVS